MTIQQLRDRRKNIMCAWRRAETKHGECYKVYAAIPHAAKDYWQQKDRTWAEIVFWGKRAEKCRRAWYRVSMKIPAVNS